MRNVVAAGLLLVVVAGTQAGGVEDTPSKEQDPAALEFFEKEVRPVIVAKCQACHGSEKQKGDLRLDSREAVLKGGRTGPAVAPGKPDESLLVDAINYGDLFQMPPKSKLSDKEIATITKWVEQGAIWPGTDKGHASGSGAVKPFDLKERAKHWSFQPVRAPALPAVKHTAWAETAVDRFILAKLEASGLAPAEDASKRTLIRRATYDLIGLPPTPQEVADFLADRSPDAFETVVERLLASPQYGERWGRHWLDLVRFAETSGHEFDYDIPNAWRYRDYVIRAFNADLPYDRFVVEHLAGDLLASPRRHPTEGFNESVLGTGFFFFGEGTHSPVDVSDDSVLRVDNQLDVMAKTFLGLTVACARCHDHKFDAISTKDYYALAGFLRSSRHQLAFLDPADKIKEKTEELRTLRAGMQAVLREGAEPAVAFKARAAGKMLAALPDRGAKEAVVFETFDGPSFDGWSTTGDAFGTGPTQVGQMVARLDLQPGLAPVPPGVAHSGTVSNRLQGVLRSRTFKITKRHIQVLAAGLGGRINVVVDGFEKIRDPIYGGLTRAVGHPQAWQWETLDVEMWLGHSAYIELADGATLDYNGGQTRIEPGEGFLAVDEIRFSDGPAPVPALSGQVARMLDDPAWYTPEAEALGDGERIDAIVARWRASVPPPKGDAARLELLDWFSRAGRVTAQDTTVGPERQKRLQDGLARYQAIDNSIPAPMLAPAIVDGTGEDVRVHIRGNYKTLGDVASRRFLEAVTGAEPFAPAQGSGRLELAKRLVDPANPFVARVMVNRIWKQHFGQGIVKTADDFGVMGQPPTHPELLDYLAAQFVKEHWSIKAMHRLMVLSHAYRMSSRPNADAERVDPTNALLHRMNVRRLEAEAIRDSVLAVSGRLDTTPFGPGVAPYLTPFMEGRGRPGQSGPLDGKGRRSVYINVRRNFLTPMFLAFDYPPPFSTMGRRNVSNVPAQALTLMNDPFIIEQARNWAARARSEAGKRPEQVVANLYETAFSRPPTERELAEALAFVQEQGRTYGQPDGAQAWADLCHVLFNVKEFVFVN